MNRDSRLLWIAVALLLVALTLQLRVASKLFGSSLAEGDPQRHFVSGAMVFDYLRTSLGSNPYHFAESYAVRYPGVAIGHWPPAYYAVQALFYSATGARIKSAQVLSALTAAVLALILFLRLKPAVGAVTSVAAAAVFLAAPLIQIAAWQVMSDLLTALFVFLAILAFCDLLDTPRSWKVAIGFAAWSILAILTKGSAWALVPFAVIAPVLAQRTQCFRRGSYWAALGLVLVGGSVFYIAVQRAGIGYQAGYARLVSPTGVSTTERIETILPLFGFAPALLLLFGLLGMADALRVRFKGTDESKWTTLSIVCGSWIAAQAIFLSILPMTAESRVMMPSIAPLIVLMVRFSSSVGNVFGQMPKFAALAPALSLAAAALIVFSSGAVLLHRVDGYREAANSMPYPATGALILAATSLEGDGALVAERLNHDTLHRDLILRGLHVFARVDSEGNYQPLVSSAEEVRNYLLQMPVRFVVLDGPPYQWPYQRLINDAVTADGSDFKLTARIPISDSQRGKIAEFRIYENPAGRDHHPSVIRTPLGLDAGYRVLEYQWQ